jgi:hypothetical protein
MDFAHPSRRVLAGKLCTLLLLVPPVETARRFLDLALSTASIASV